MRRPRGPGGRFLTAAEIAAGLGGVQQESKEENHDHEGEHVEGTSPVHEEDPALHPTAESESAPSPDLGGLAGSASVAGNTNTATTDAGTPRSGKADEEEHHLHDAQAVIVPPEDLDPGMGADPGFIAEQLQTFDGSGPVAEVEGYEFDPAAVVAGAPKFVEDPQLPITGVDGADGFAYPSQGEFSFSVFVTSSDIQATVR